METRVAVGGEGEGVQLRYGGEEYVSWNSFPRPFQYCEIHGNVACEICLGTFKRISILLRVFHMLISKN